MAAVIGGISLVKIRAHSVLRARNIHNCGIRDWLAVAVNNCPRNTRSVSADHNVQPWLGTDRKTRIRYIPRSEEHTSELQSRFDLVCRLLLEKKNNFYTWRLHVL